MANHPENPPTGHTVTTEQPGNHVVVRIDDRVVAETDNPLAVHETHLPLRWYIPPSDVRVDLLRPTSTSTVCPFKGTASYYSYGDRDDIAWTYETPLPEQEALAGQISFLGDGVTTEVDSIA